MLKKRLIPLLLLKNGRMVKGKQFRDFRDTGDPVSASRIYNAQNVDELMFLDIEASQEGRMALLGVIEKVSKECFMPLTVGGGVSSVNDVRSLLAAGADKVVINTAAVLNPELIRETSGVFGSQCIVAGVDLKKENGDYAIYTHCGRKKSERNWIGYLKLAEENGAGEILINSIDQDGMMQGFDLSLASQAVAAVSVPVIICGGAGHFMHLVDALLETGVSAVACASIFHFGDNNPIRAKSYLKNKGIPVKNV